MHVRSIEPAFAASLLGEVKLRDASGVRATSDVRHITAHGLCTLATCGEAWAVWVLRIIDNTAVVAALGAKAKGCEGWRDAIFTTIEKQCAGFDAIVFETARPGLMRLARKRGYTVTGWHMKKAKP